jgi:hypothetical protein
MVRRMKKVLTLDCVLDPRSNRVLKPSYTRKYGAHCLYYMLLEKFSYRMLCGEFTNYDVLPH